MLNHESEICSFALGRGPVEYGEAVVSRRKTVKSCREICRFLCSAAER